LITLISISLSIFGNLSELTESYDSTGDFDDIGETIDYDFDNYNIFLTKNFNFIFENFSVFLYFLKSNSIVFSANITFLYIYIFSSITIFHKIGSG
jgi:hypothetical protein